MTTQNAISTAGSSINERALLELRNLEGWIDTTSRIFTQLGALFGTLREKGPRNGELAELGQYMADTWGNDCDLVAEQARATFFGDL
ncbi:hypothetical protein [Dyella sp. C11]|uniref:hypothetical protein n=1 Tax=Dyella sp. C11 TaxID=2126991 RepID=UPI000D64294A|nr:hypothetical protein [Dyella sp. C11]